MNTSSSRTPDGGRGECPVCGRIVRITPSAPMSDATCPGCGVLLSIGRSSHDSECALGTWGPSFEAALCETLAMEWGITPGDLPRELTSATIAGLGLDSLEVVEVLLEAERRSAATR